jgi:hypothetical protein
MTEGADQNQDTVDRLQTELDALLRQHEQYTLALDAAVDSRTSLRLQRTLERLDEEIEGLREALKGYEPQAVAGGTSPLPSDPSPVPPQPPEPTDEEASSGPAILPEWDDDDEEEPATAIFSTDGSDPYATAGLSYHAPIPAQPGFTEEDPPTVTLEAQPQAGGQAPAGQPMAPVAASPTTNVTPPSQPTGDGSDEDPATVTMTVRGAQAPAPAPGPAFERPAAPPGGASFSSLPPPAAGWGHTEIVPPSYETQPRALGSVSPPTQPMSSSPFAAQQQAQPSSSPLSAGSSDSGSPSPFGGPPAAPHSSFPSGPYDTVGSGSSDGEWSLGSRLLLALVVLLFLGGVAYILSQGP